MPDPDAESPCQKQTCAEKNEMLKPADFGHTIVVVPDESQLATDDSSQAPTANPNNVVVNEKAFRIRLADTKVGRASAGLLINRMYSWRGYGSNHQLAETPERITLTASSNDQVVGTATLGIDSAMGLLADEVFKDQIDRFRGNGSKVCEITKLAFDRGHHSNRVIAALFHIIFIYGRRFHSCTDVFIEVNPRHRVFYERMLGFRALCDIRSNPRVNAPAYLLWADIGVIETQILKYGGTADLGGIKRSLYPYFFSPKEEDGLANRLRQLG